METAIWCGVAAFWAFVLFGPREPGEKSQATFVKAILVAVLAFSIGGGYRFDRNGRPLRPVREDAPETARSELRLR